MLRTDGSSPAKIFFNITQKQGLPILNPNAKPFEPDTLYDQRIQMCDQHSVIIKDLAPGQEVLTQYYLLGLWSDSAVVLSKREDGRSYWVKDNRSRQDIHSMQKTAQAISPSTDSGQETSNNLVDVSISRFTMAMQQSNKTLKTKLHSLPASVVRSASHQPLQIQQERIPNNTSICVVCFILRTNSNRRTGSIQRTLTISTIPKDLSHFYNITSSLPRLCFTHSPMVLLLDLLFPRDLFGVKTQSTAPGSAQSAQGKNIQEVSYQEGHQPHWKFRVSLYRNPPRDSGFNANSDHPLRISPLLSEVPQVPVPRAITALESKRKISAGISESERQPPRDESNGRPRRLSPTAPRPGIRTDCNLNTTWWSLSECNLISEQSSPQPLTEYQKIDIGVWIQEAVKHSEEFSGIISFSNCKTWKFWNCKKGSIFIPKLRELE